MGLLSAFLFVTVVTSIVYFIAKHLQLRNQLKGINCPRSYPLIGHGLLKKPDMEGFINQVMGMAQMYPDSPRMVLFWLGPVPVVMLYSARLVEKILNCSQHLNKGIAYYFFESWLGQGIITSNVDNWRPKRKLLTPTFHYDILKDFVPIFNDQAQILVKKFASLPEGKPVELMSYITLCALDIICETSMGKSLNAQLDKESEYVKAVHTVNDLVQKRTKSPLYWNDYFYNKFGEGETEKKCIDILHSFTNKIAERRKELEDKQWRFEGRRAFLDLLLDMANSGQLEASEIQEQVDTLMFAGHDTTSTGSSWALFLFGCYPEIQRKVQEEIDEVLEDSDYILPEHLPRLKYLECCLKESLRLCTPVPMIMRKLGADQELEGVTLPKGTQVVLNQYMVHRDPMYWPDPEKFDPDRFLPENCIGRHPFAFIPFSAGSRNCIGQRFGLMEIKVVVSWMLRHFNVTAVQRRCDLKSKIEIILRPQDGIHVFLEKRRAIADGFRSSLIA
uniref:Cytochrome P450 domain containing protein n=1 Tax=Haemonchus contortus TaxID=6289 RepID=A0A7I5E703_HAECO